MGCYSRPGIAPETQCLISLGCFLRSFLYSCAGFPCQGSIRDCERKEGRKVGGGEGRERGKGGGNGEAGKRVQTKGNGVIEGVTQSLVWFFHILSM
jgi:hypothetical protein